MTKKNQRPCQSSGREESDITKRLQKLCIFFHFYYIVFIYFYSIRDQFHCPASGRRLLPPLHLIFNILYCFEIFYFSSTVFSRRARIKAPYQLIFSIGIYYAITLPTKVGASCVTAPRSHRRQFSRFNFGTTDEKQYFYYLFNLLNQPRDCRLCWAKMV